jgi:hypothetical protein
MNIMNKQGVVSRRIMDSRYSAIRCLLKTYDVINCEHKDLFWRIIGHTAMIYNDIATGQLFVYESTSLNKFTGIKGVQLTPLRLWLRYYPGKVKVRRMMFAEELRHEEEKIRFLSQLKIREHIKRFRGVPYPDLSDPVQRDFLLNSAIDLPFGLAENQDRHNIFFCTHLVVDAWQDGGLYIGDQVPPEYEPDDMREGGSFEKHLKKGVYLDKELDLNEKILGNMRTGVC